MLADITAKKVATDSSSASEITFPFPDPISPSDRFMNHMFSEGGVIRGAPVIFFSLLLGIVVVLCLLFWALFNWQYGSQIQTLQAQIQLLTAQKDDALDELGKANNQLHQQGN
jgi:hypothetical protein